MRWLVERIQCQPASGRGDGWFKLVGRDLALDEAFERARQLAAQALGLRKLPIVESRAIAKTETGQKIVAIQRHGFDKRCLAGGARRAGRMWMATADCEPSLEFVEIDPEALLTLKRKGVAVYFQPGAVDRAVKGRQRPSEGRARSRLIRI